MGLLLILGLLGGVTWFIGRDSQFSEPETPIVKFVDRPTRTPLRSTIRIDSKIFSCSAGRCSLETSSGEGLLNITDGTWRYFYETKIDQNQGQEKVFLQRENLQSRKTETIMESTPLTEPREIYLSPNGQQAAFWLDNIADPAKRLTELWVYDTKRGGIRLIAEKLFVPDIRSEPRWNNQSNYLYLIADTGPRIVSSDQLEIIRMGTQPPSVTVGFRQEDWKTYLDGFNELVSDMSGSGEDLAYIATNLLGYSILNINHLDDQERTTVQGQIPYVRWLANNSLLYAVQDQRGFTFWRVDGGVHRFMARRPGHLAAAQSDETGEYVVFATLNESTVISINSLHTVTGTVVEEGELKKTGDTIQFVSVKKEETSVSSELLPIGEHDDAEITALIERRINDIANNSSARATKLIFTDQSNTVFLEYRVTATVQERVLLTVLDVLHDEWIIKGRYSIVDGTWRKIQGGGLADPKPIRLYEWEQAIEQWILKQNNG